MMFRYAAAMIASLAATQALAADFVLMKNGDRVTGEVKQVWNGEVYIEPEYGDEYAIDLDYVAHVHTEEPFEVDIRIGRRIETVSGRLGLSEKGTAAVIGESGEPLYPLAMVDNMQEIEEYFDWSFRTDLAVNISEGNTETSSSRLSVYGAVKLGDHHHEVTLTRDEQRASDDLTKDQSEVMYQDTWTFSDKWFVRGTLSWVSDPIRDLEYRNRLFVGPGYHIFDDSKRRLNFSFGPEYVNEEIAGEKDRSAAFKVMLDYEQKFLSDDLVVFQSSNFTRIFEGRPNKLFQLGAGIRYDVTDDIYLSLQTTYNYESNPAADRKQEDFTYLMGVGMELD